MIATYDTQVNAQNQSKQQDEGAGRKVAFPGLRDPWSGLVESQMPNGDPPSLMLWGTEEKKEHRKTG